MTAATFNLADALKVKSVLDDPAAGPVLLHCASANRVGGVLAVLEAEAGKPVDRALEAGRDAGLKSEAMVEAVKRVLAERTLKP
jgi:rhodanese-related sulfurtransferase